MGKQITLGTMYTGQDKTTEQALDDLFPHGPEFSLDGNHFDSPLTIIDAEDNIIAWYLPNIISRDAHV